MYVFLVHEVFAQTSEWCRVLVTDAIAMLIHITQWNKARDTSADVGGKVTRDVCVCAGRCQ